jgi:predicted TIM-barrel fold metal-dependent hydrolase
MHDGKGIAEEGSRAGRAAQGKAALQGEAAEKALREFMAALIKANSAGLGRLVERIQALFGCANAKPRHSEGIVATALEAIEYVLDRESGKLAERPEPYLHTAGFDYQLEKMLGLQGADAGRVFPFLAVDPRREGLAEYVIAGNYLDKAHGPFYGIKIYPRLGYRPDVQALEGLYAYCAAKGFPVTAHCSEDGFPMQSLFKDWSYGPYGDPENYRAILAANPSLRIDLAHFANQPDRSWALKILELMRAFPDGAGGSRVFSDLSCYSGPDDLVRWLADVGADPLARGQTMFGSDFDVMYFTAKLPLEDYYARFKSTAGLPPMEDMAGAIPRRFLAP